MRSRPFAFALLAGVLPLAAQEPAPAKWDVSIPEPIADGKPAAPVPRPAPIDFADLTTRTKRVDVVEAPEMPDLPPVTGKINVTVKLVEDPNLPPPPPPLEAVAPTDPQVIARLEELREKHGGTELIFLSCTVYDHHRSLVRIYPNGKVDQEVVAWSNLDFNHFSGFSTYQVKDGVDGTLYDYGLLMGLGNEDTGRLRQRLEQADQEYQAPEIPDIADLSVGGPAFVVVKGEAGSPAMATLEQIHDLYRQEGARMEAAYLAREKAQAERKAYLLANPPTPSDVTIRFWRKARPQSSPPNPSR